jgi:hypothetical protein
MIEGNFPLSFAPFLNKRSSMHRIWLKALSTLVLPLLWLAGCASSPSRLSVPISGGQTVHVERQGAGFKQAENDRAVITEAGLQAVNLDGTHYVRWTFALRPKQANALSTVRIEDVSDSTPLLLVNDVAPQLEAGKYTANAGLMGLSSASARWLFEPSESIRIFRFTIGEPDGQSDVLYQAVQYSPAAKEAIRAMVR